MNVSDIIVLLTLVIAIVAILNEKNREQVRLKFSRFDTVLLAVAFLLINYFVFYKSFYIRHLYIAAFYFRHYGFHHPGNWAYVITLAAIAYVLHKIYYSFYPNNRAPLVVAYYNQEIENSEISFVFNPLSRYHHADIIRYIQDGPAYNPEIPWHERFAGPTTRHQRWEARLRSARAVLFTSSWANRREYARAVLDSVIATPAFLALASPLRPYFFPGIFRQFRLVNRDRFPRDTINPYLEQLIAHRNFWLEKELKESADNAPTQPDWFFENNSILAALWQDLSVADVNEVWRPFGDAALGELRAERAKGLDSDLFTSDKGEEDEWKIRTHWSIQFFYSMVNQAIVTGYTESHFWLYYYDRMVESIVNILDEYLAPDQPRQNVVYDTLMEEIKRNLFSWLDSANRHRHPGLYHDILDCIGNCLYWVTSSSSYGEERILEWLGSLFFHYCHLENNAYTDALRTKYETVMRHPSLLSEPDDAYFGYLADAWRRFDKIPHRAPGRGVEYPYFARLKENVIIPMGMDPNAW
jgi:hypothetical protein